MQDRVIFTGFLEAPARIYPALDLYLSTSLKEGLPLSLVEAMGAGLATVATDAGHRDVLVHGKTGLLIPADDDAALANAVVSLWTDPIKRAALGRATRQWAREEFGIQQMLERQRSFAGLSRLCRAGTTRLLAGAPFAVSALCK